MKSQKNSLSIDSGTRSFRVPKTAELLAGELRNKIIRNQIPDGHPLPSENDLMQQYSISRPTLREALRILESEGLITVTRGIRGGPRAHKPDPRFAAQHFGRILQNRGTTLGDIFTARMLIEPICARFLAERGKKSVITELRRHLAACEKSFDDDVEFPVMSTRFHNAIIELSGNKPLILLMATLNHIFELHIDAATVSSSLNELGGSASKRANVDAMSQMLKCIEAGDADGAEDTARQFLTQVDKRLAKARDVNSVIDVLE